MPDPLLQGRVTNLCLHRGCAGNTNHFPWLADVPLGETVAPLPITAEGCVLVQWGFSGNSASQRKHSLLPFTLFSCKIIKYWNKEGNDTLTHNLK